MINIVLHEPEIADNTANIGRTCVCANSFLHIIEPTKFRLTKEYIRKAGLDYWDRLNVKTYINYIDFLCKNNLLSAINIENIYLKNYQYVLDEYGININDYKNKFNADKKLFFATTKAHKTYVDVDFKDGDYIMFGKESAGIPEEILSLNEEYCIRIPMFEKERSINLSNSVAIVLYEALRQLDFLNLEKKGELHELQYK